MGTDIKIRDFSFKSSNGEDTVRGAAYEPEAQAARAVVLISHGMVEHIGRYHGFMLYLARQGFAAVGHDHLGHGRTASDPDRLGYFAAENGYQCLLRDLNQVRRIAGKLYGGKKCFLLGHSMGSLIARLYCVKYPDAVDGAVFMGTPAPNALTPAALALAQRYIRRQGPFFRPPLLQKWTLDDLNNRITPARTPKDWLSRDEAAVDANLADPLCNFTFTASAFADLYAMHELSNAPKWAREYPKALPTLLVSGDCDAVGNFGRGVLQIYNRLLSAGVEDLQFDLYKGARHELLNETNREEVYGDLLRWFTERLGKAGEASPGDAGSDLPDQEETPDIGE